MQHEHRGLPSLQNSGAPSRSGAIAILAIQPSKGVSATHQRSLHLDQGSTVDSGHPCFGKERPPRKMPCEQHQYRLPHSLCCISNGLQHHRSAERLRLVLLEPRSYTVREQTLSNLNAIRIKPISWSRAMDMCVNKAKVQEPVRSITRSLALVKLNTPSLRANILDP